MTTLETRVREIRDIEGFDIQVFDDKKNVVDTKNNGFISYGYGNRAKGSMTVNDWKVCRFRATYPGYDCRVLNANGSEAHGNTLIETVRSTYEEQ